MLGPEAQVNDGVLDAGDQACYEISVLGPEAQVSDGVLDAGDQAYDDVMFMLNANAKVDDDQFVLDAVDQNYVDDDQFVLDAVDQNYVEEHTMNDEAQVNDAVLDSGGPSDAEEYASNAEEQVYYEAMNMIGCKTTPCAFPHRTRDLVSVGAWRRLHHSKPRARHRLVRGSDDEARESRLRGATRQGARTR